MNAEPPANAVLAGPGCPWKRSQSGAHGKIGGTRETSDVNIRRSCRVDCDGVRPLAEASVSAATDVGGID